MQILPSLSGITFQDIVWILPIPYPMVTSSNGYIFRVTGHLCGELSPRTKASDAEL